MRRAVRIRRRPFWGAVRANSRAVERPMPEEAPVTTMVLPVRRFAAAEDDILRMEERIEAEGKRAVVRELMGQKDWRGRRRRL